VETHPHLNFKAAHLLRNSHKIVNGQLTHGLAKMKSQIEIGGVTHEHSNDRPEAGNPGRI